MNVNSGLLILLVMAAALVGVKIQGSPPLTLVAIGALVALSILVSQKVK